MSGALVLGSPWAAALELITAARKLGSSPIAVAGYQDEVNVKEAGEYGVESVYLMKRQLPPASLAKELAKLANELSPGVIIGPSTKDAREALTRMAHSLGIGCVNDCLTVEKEGESIRVSRLVLGGGYLAVYEFSSKPAVLTLQPKRYVPERAETAVEPKVIEVDVEVNGKLKVVERKTLEKSEVDLESAEIIVSVGRGFRKKEDITLAEELAKTIGGEIGCSRPIAGDLKWLPEDRHIGLSGKWVRPKLYIAIGISGQIQHIVGIRGSKVIVAINNDPNAPIHMEADYSVVADLYEFVPILTQKLKQQLSR